MDGIVLWLAAVVCGVPMRRLLSAAGLPIVSLFATLAVVYFGLLKCIAHRTFGTRALELGRRVAASATMPRTPKSSSHARDAVLRETIAG